MLVFTFQWNEPQEYHLSKRYSYLDSWSDIYWVVSILLDRIFIEYDTEILFALSSNTSIHIEIKWMKVVSVLNNIFVSASIK